MDADECGCGWMGVDVGVDVCVEVVQECAYLLTCRKQGITYPGAYDDKTEKPYR